MHGQIAVSNITTTGQIRPRFVSEEQIRLLKRDKKYKINVRNNLGVRDHTNWIYNLNIANVMNMTPMNADELESSGNEDDKLY